jgi:hypothetical protein
MGKKLLQLVKSPIILQQSSRELPAWQNALIGFTAWFWLFSVVGDLLLVSGSYSIEPDNLVAFPFLLLIFGIVFLFPLTMSIRGIQYIYDYLKHQKLEIPFYKHILNFLGWLIHAAVLIVWPFYVFLFLDVKALTLVPFLTTVSALLWLGVGVSLTKNQPTRKRLIIIPLAILFILSVKFIDWNSRKPFLRDLYSVKTGMAGAEVKNIMEKYDKPGIHREPRSGEYLNSEFTGEESYWHTREGWGNADIGTIRFQNGQVIEVKFLHD